MTPSSAGYQVNVRALRRWSQERLTIAPGDEARLHCCFRFEGSTCSNMGMPLAFSYHVTLGTAEAGHPILDMDCVPAEGAEGHRSMCSFLERAEGILATLREEKPLLGQPLQAVLAWQPRTLPAGCVCTQPSRHHKWLIVLQTIHYALDPKETMR